MIDDNSNGVKQEEETPRIPMKEWKCKSSDLYTKIILVGSGTFGKVFKAKSKIRGDIVALKQIIIGNEKEGFPITAIRETMIMQRLNHKNILKLIEIVTSPPNEKKNRNRGNVYLVFEYMEHDISGLADIKIHFTLPIIKCIMHQILCGVQYLHECNIIHRDIKCANILLNNKGEIKIGDFGLARIINPNTSISKHYTNRVVTLWYRAPELLLGETNYGFAIDVWSIGCVFSELLTGCILFRGIDDNDQVEKIFAKCGTPNNEIWPGVTSLQDYNRRSPKTVYKYSLKDYYKNFSKVDETAFDLISKMVRLNPNKRITLKDALNHAFFTTHEPQMCKSEELPRIEQDSHEHQYREGLKNNLQAQEQHQQVIKEMTIGNQPYISSNNNNTLINKTNNLTSGNDNSNHEFLGLKRNKPESE